jgi:hypothetical protein
MNKILIRLTVVLSMTLVFVVIGTGLLLFSAPATTIPTSNKVIEPPPIAQIPGHFVTPAPSQPLFGNERMSIPIPVYGVYSTAWVAGTKRIDSIINFIKQTNMNTLVIDIKDDTGIISFPSQNQLAREIGAGSKRIPNLKELLARLKQERIYTIARIVVFKDPLLARKRPEIAVQDKNGGLWRDRKGMTWVDPNNRLVWKYNLDIAKEAVSMGFSEIQYDYVRFLSDGLLRNCIYPFSNGTPKEDVIRDFLLYAKKELNTMGVTLSADIFGLVLTVPDDLNIGQKLEKIASAVDYISPMVYPSHYPKGSFSFPEPNRHPYEVILKALQDGNKRIKESKAKFRPWIQDFDLGYPPYRREQLAAEIKALEDNGIHDFLFWNPGNHYDPAKYPNLEIYSH